LETTSKEEKSETSSSSKEKLRKELENLKSFFNDGLINELEYTRKKEQLLGLSYAPRKRKLVAISGSQWKEKQLDTFGVRFKDCATASEFFGYELSPLDGFDLEFLDSSKSLSLDSLKAKRFPDGPSFLFSKKLYMVIYEDKNRESAVDDMVVHLLESLGFSDGNWLVRSRRESTLYMSGEEKEAIADVSVIDLSHQDIIRLCVVEDKSYGKETDNAVTISAEAQLIAEAVSASQLNTVDPTIMFMIRVIGEKMTFYRGDIRKLAKIVEIGEETQEETIIKRYGSHGFQLLVERDREEIINVLCNIRRAILAGSYYSKNKELKV